MMPKLKKISITVDKKVGEDVYEKWPSKCGGYVWGSNVHYSYSSVRKLEIHSYCGPVNILEVKSVFPCLAKLYLSLEHLSQEVPCGEISELWPDLEKVTCIYDIENVLTNNCDAQFCGISEKEAEVLREMDEEYLRNVHIVPIRPSLLTMPSKS